MPLFSRRRATVAEPGPATWRPLTTEPLSVSGDAGNMDDDGQAFPFVHQIVFGLGHPDGPVINVCTYVVYGAEPGTYVVGLRYTYTSEAHPGWSYTGWMAEPLGEIYPDTQSANDHASWWAYCLGRAFTPLKIALPEVFGWDGTVF